MSPLLDITPELSRAAALVAEAEAAGKNSSAILNKRGTFWMQDIERRGTSPWGSDPDYKVGSFCHAALSMATTNRNCRYFAMFKITVRKVTA